MQRSSRKKRVGDEGGRERERENVNDGKSWASLLAFPIPAPACRGCICLSVCVMIQIQIHPARLICSSDSRPASSCIQHDVAASSLTHLQGHLDVFVVMHTDAIPILVDVFQLEVARV